MFFDVELSNNVLVIQAAVQCKPQPPRGVILTEVANNADRNEAILHETQPSSLYDLDRRLGHLNYDAVEKLARDPASGIILTDRHRGNCLTCTQGKQSKNRQPKHDTGANSPIDRIGGVICSDLKGPMTPRDRLGNRYMIKFVDHKSNYVKVFLAKTKDKAAKVFAEFLVFFEKRFDCRIYVLRTDSGGEYANIDLFCKLSGVARQRSEARNQASNGKAERMHRTIMNMARCIIFASGLPLTFWKDAV